MSRLIRICSGCAVEALYLRLPSRRWQLAGDWISRIAARESCLAPIVSAFLRIAL